MRRPSGRTYQLPRPTAPIAGLEQTFVFPRAVQQPPPRGIRARDQPHVEVPPFDAPAPQQTSVFPLSQPTSNRRRYQVRPSVAVRSGTVLAVSAQTVFTYPVVQPEPTRTQARVDRIRSRQDVPHVIHQGPTVDTDQIDWKLTATHVDPGRRRLQRVYEAWWVHQIVPTGDAVYGTAVYGSSTYPYPEVQGVDATPLARYWARPAPVLIRRSIRGVTPAPQIPPAVWPAPVGEWWARREQGRRTSRVVIQLTGAITHQTSVFLLEQPSRTAWDVRRAAVDRPPVPRLDGAETQALSLFTLSQPQGWTPERLVSRFVVTPQTEGTFIAPAVAQTSLFEPGQPSRTQWYVPRTPAEHVPAPVQIGQGATVVGTDPIPEVGGSSHAHWPWRYPVFETATRSLSPIVWSAIIVIPVPDLAAADACDTFRIGADLGAFVLGADVGRLRIGADRGSFVMGADPGTFLLPGCGDDE